MRLSDGNNKYFHASIKMRNQFKSMQNIHRSDGTIVRDQKELESEVLDFYKNLMGKKENDLEGIDVSAMRDGT